MYTVGIQEVIQEVTRSEVEVKPKVYNRSNQKFTKSVRGHLEVARGRAPP